MNNNYPIGICVQMCPDEEIIRREREGRMHVLEVPPSGIKSKKPQPSINYMVKEFSRSAAGRVSEDVKNLRTQDALLQTVGYLLHDVISNENVPWNVVYDFIMDRLRAVRQDMVIQNMSRAFCISLLQPIIKFYVYSAYRLCEAPISIYDPVINNTHLQECLKRLLSMYDDLDILFNKAAKSGDSVTRNLLYSECRPFMESLYLILNLSNTTAMERALQLPLLWKNNLVRKCLKISLDCWRGNYVRVCREILTLPPLLQACAVLHLPRIRKKALATMSIAYNSKTISFPANILQKLLIYDNINDLFNDCVYYGISIDDDKICFNKATFQTNKPEQPRKKSALVDELLDHQNIPKILLEENLKEFIAIQREIFDVNPENGSGDYIEETKMSGEGNDGTVCERCLTYLHAVRDPVAEYQEKKGIPKDESYTFYNLVTAVGSYMYNALQSMGNMLGNLLPIFDAVLLILRFVIDKLIDIFETSDQNDQVVKAGVFLVEFIPLFFIIGFIHGFIFLPLYALFATVLSKFWHFII